MMRLLCRAGATLALSMLLLPALRADTPREGEPAPNVELPAAYAGKGVSAKKDGDNLNLKDFQGKKNVVLFFFPKAMTRG